MGKNLNLQLKKQFLAFWTMLLGLGAFVVSLWGIIDQSIYDQLIDKEVLPGTISQDLITSLVSLVLLGIQMRKSGTGVRVKLLEMSLLLYLFYGYGIYVIERIYNPFYFLYLGIMTSSFWLVIVQVPIIQELSNRLSTRIIDSKVRIVSIFFLLGTVVLFSILWIGQLLPLIANRQKIEFFYSIYILDGVFVLPAIAFVAFLLFKKHPLGFLLTPVLFLKIFFLLFSVGLGHSIEPWFGFSSNHQEYGFFFILSGVYGILGIVTFMQCRHQKVLPYDS